MSDLPAGYVLDAAAQPSTTAALPPGYVLDQPSVAADVAKTVPSSLVKGTLGVVGSGGDSRHLGNLLIDKAGDYLGAPDWLKSAARGVNNAGSLIANPGSIMTSGDLRKSAETLTGPLYDAKTVPGQYAGTVAEFLPAALGGEGSLIPRVLKQAVVPALASETAGQATRGTAAEPIARIAGGLGAALLPSATTAALRAGGVLPTLKTAPTIEEVKAAAKAGYQHPDVAGVQIHPDAINEFVDKTIDALKREKFNDRRAGHTHDLLNELREPVNGQVHTFEDIQTTREQLGTLARGAPSPEQAAASKALKALDTYEGSIPQRDILSGDAAKAAGIIQDARSNYASAKTAERVQDRLNNAEVQAASTYSGGNLNNATRQKLRPLLTSKKEGRGLTDDELEQIGETVKGGAVGNTLRAAGKFLGGGGGMHGFFGATTGAGVGAALGGPLGALVGAAATPVAGYAMKKAGDAITRTNADKIVNAILSRSALARNAPQPAVRSDPIGNFGWLPMVGAQASVPQRVE